LVSRSFGSLITIDKAMTALKKIMSSIEENSVIYSRMRKNISEEMELLKNQLLYSLNTIDDISILSAQICSLSQVLNTLRNIISSDKKSNVHHLTGVGNTELGDHLDNQFRFFVNENIRAINKLSASKEPPLFPRQIFQDIKHMVDQINDLNISINELADYREHLGTGMAEVVEFVSRIEMFFEETKNVCEHINASSHELSVELKKIEDVVSSTDKIFSKIKSLAVFAKIEEGRSAEYRGVISPIVDQFVQLESETERTFTNLIPQIAKLRKDVDYLKNERPPEFFGRFEYPDYSKIKIFLDDIIRVFREEQKRVHEVYDIASVLAEANKELELMWRKYENSINQLSTMRSSFGELLKQKKGVAPSVSKKKSVVSAYLSSDPLTLNPDLRTDINSQKVICNYSKGLFQFGEGVDLIPAICEDYSISQDGTEYTFKIRDGLKYQDGEKLRIEHLKNALINALSGPNASFFNMIAGAKDFAESNELQTLGIRIVNNNTLTIKLEYPFLPILANLAANIADPYFYQEKLPIGLGPFRIIDWQKEKKIVYVANPYYFEGQPTLDEFHYLIIKESAEAYECFKKGILSIYQPTGDEIAEIKMDASKMLYTVPELSVRHLCMNCQKKPFDNRLVRKAVAYAIDRRYLIDTCLKGTAIAAKGIFPPSMKVYNHKLVGYTFDPRRAKDLLTQAGYKNGLPDIYPLDTNNTPTSMRLAEVVRSYLADVNIRVEINPLPWENLLEKSFSGQSILAFRGWIGDNGDPDNFVYPLFHSNSFGRTGNTFFFSTPKIDKDIDEARKIRNLHQRVDLYRKIEEEILDECPAVFLFHLLRNIAIEKSILGYKPHPLGILRTQYIYPFGGQRLASVENEMHKPNEVSNLVYTKS
jgi:peptide/nickel transport system substrate-binding protein